MRPDLRVVFVSGYSRDIFAEDYACDDAAVFIQKPVSTDVLLTTGTGKLDKNSLKVSKAHPLPDGVQCGLPYLNSSL